MFLLLLSFSYWSINQKQWLILFTRTVPAWKITVSLHRNAGSLKAHRTIFCYRNIKAPKEDVLSSLFRHNPHPVILKQMPVTCSIKCTRDGPINREQIR